MRYGTKSIALTLFALIAACASDPGPRPGPGSGSGSGPGSSSGPGPSPGPGSGSNPGPGPGPGPADVPDALCERFDTCNILEDSVDNCIQKLNRELGIFTANERADFEMVLQSCLALRSCDTFAACAEPILVVIESAGS